VPFYPCQQLLQGPKGDIGYGTECVAAVTVDIALATGSTLAGVGATQVALLLGASPPLATTIGILVFLGVLWFGPELREPLIEAVNEVYKGFVGDSTVIKAPLDLRRGRR
jgi:hypothetical protein